MDALDNRRIVVATDLDAHGAAVIPYAKALALTWGAQVMLLHVVPEPHDTTDLEAKAREWMRLEEADREIDRERRRLEGDAIPCHFEVRFGGDPGQVIREYADEVDAMAILVHPHHHGAWEKVWGSSVTEELLREPRRPVLVIPAKRSGRPLLRRAVYASHFRDRYPGLDLVREVAEMWDGDITMLHVAPEHPVEDENGQWEGCGLRVSGDFAAEVRRRAAADRQSIHDGDQPSRVLVEWSDDEAATIQEFLDADESELLAVPSTCAARLQLLTGDHSLRSCRAPVLVTPG